MLSENFAKLAYGSKPSEHNYAVSPVHLVQVMREYPIRRSMIALVATIEQRHVEVDQLVVVVSITGADRAVKPLQTRTYRTWCDLADYFFINYHLHWVFDRGTSHNR
jgi:hypothetical protein